MSPGRRVWAICGAALVLRLVLLLVRGDYIVYDEGYYLLLAESLRHGHGFALNGLPHVALSPLQPLLVAGLTFVGVGAITASRLLAATAGALLVIPVMFLARRWFCERAALAAGAFVAVSPGLLTFLPFFPGERWNLYFGSEPLFLLSGVSAVAVAVRAADDGGWRWWIALGALLAGAYLTRLEGAVLGAGIAAATIASLGARGRWRLLPRAAAAALVGLAAVTPYLLYLHGTLGRWAVSGRVQAAASVEDAPAVTPPGGSGGGSDAVRSFVWGGDREALWRALYALDASGTRMVSQYWGVARRGASDSVHDGEGEEDRGAPRRALSGRSPARSGPPSPSLPPGSPARSRPPSPSLSQPSGASPPRLSSARVVWQAVTAVAPWWFLLLALPGLAGARRRGEAALWLAPMLLTAVLPAALAYVEPRALLMLVPLACLLAAGTVEALLVRLSAARPRPWMARGLIGAATLGLLAPTARDLARAWGQGTALQQVAGARRAVGAYLGRHLPADAVIVSWHPAIGIFAGREWRVLPYGSFERIVGYARAQGASAVVFSRFEPSPLRDPPRAFTIVLLDSASSASGANIRLAPVDETPLLFVGRLAAAPAPTAP